MPAHRHGHLGVNGILLDTNAYARFKSGDADVMSIMSNAPSIAFNTVVLGELYGGFAAGNRIRENRVELAALLALPQVRVLSLTASTADIYGDLFARLRAAGTPVPSNYLWIAASAIEHSLDMLTFDRHFKVIPGLRAGSKPADFRLTDDRG